MNVAAMSECGAAGAGTWYVKRGDQVHGPYSWEIIHRNIGLGRVRPTDRLSNDRHLWLPVDELVPLPSGALRALPAHDERRSDRRSEAASIDAPDEHRGLIDRRAPEAPELRARRERSAHVWAELRPPPLAARRALLAIGLVLAVLVAVAAGLAIPRERTIVDCNGSARAGAVWDFCNKAGMGLDDAQLDRLSARSAQFSGASMAAARLSGADLAYADLSGTDLRLAEMRDARLIGASLRHATLNHANLAGADLRYADLGGASVDGTRLTGARLDHAIWVDGRLCGLNSVGHCRL